MFNKNPRVAILLFKVWTRYTYPSFLVVGIATLDVVCFAEMVEGDNNPIN